MLDNARCLVLSYYDTCLKTVVLIAALGLPRCSPCLSAADRCGAELSSLNCLLIRGVKCKVPPSVSTGVAGGLAYARVRDKMGATARGGAVSVPSAKQITSIGSCV